MRVSIFLALAALFLSGCTTYAGIEKGDNNDYYLVKNSYVLFFSMPSVERCVVNNDKKLNCAVAK